MNDQTINRELSDLISQITGVPQPGAGKSRRDLPTHRVPAVEPAHRHLAAMQESLDHLRLAVKYLLFDLEATRRENEYLQDLLDREFGRRADLEGFDEDPV